MSIPTVLTRCAAISLLAFALSACGSSGPSGPTLRPYTAPPSQATISTPTSSSRPSVPASPTPDVSSGPASPAALRTMLTNAGFICGDLPDGLSYNCSGADAAKGNGYLFAVVVSNSAISAFSLSVRASGSATSPDIAAASAYFGAVIDLIVPGGSNSSPVVRAALAAPGQIWVAGPYLFASLAPDTSSLAITGSLSAALAKRIVVPSSNFDSVLGRLGYTCAPSSAVTPKPQTDCANSGDTVSYQVGEDGMIYKVGFSATTKASIEKVTAVILMPTDAGAFDTWLEAAGSSATVIFGPYAVSLSSKNGIFTLVISLS